MCVYEYCVCVFCDCMDISQYVFPFNQVNDEELIRIFSDVQYNVTNNDMSSDVALQENDAGENGIFNDLDPDDNFFVSNIPIKYWLPNEFNEISDVVANNSHDFIFSILTLEV